MKWSPFRIRWLRLLSELRPIRGSSHFFARPISQRRKWALRDGQETDNWAGWDKKASRNDTQMCIRRIRTIIGTIKKLSWPRRHQYFSWWFRGLHPKLSWCYWLIFFLSEFFGTGFGQEIDCHEARWPFSLNSHSLEANWQIKIWKRLRTSLRT